MEDLLDIPRHPDFFDNFDDYMQSSARNVE